MLAVLVWTSLAAPVVWAGEASTSSSTAQNPDPLASALNAIYNVEYDKAESILRGWIKQHPADLHAWNYFAKTLLDQEMAREGLFSGAVYSNTGRIFQKRSEPLPKDFAAKLNAALNQAQTLEQDRLKENPKDEEALYWLSVTDSTRTEFEFALLRSYYAALKEGKQAWRINLRLLKMDPNYTDAYFVVGLTDYVAGLLPWYVKLIASISGIHGNRARGIAELRRVRESGHYAKTDATIVLVGVYDREKLYPQALGLLRELEHAYPEDFLVPLEMARIDQAEGNWRAAVKLYDASVAKFVHGEKYSSRIPNATILCKAGEAHERLGDLEGALELYHEAENLPGKSLEIYQAELAAANLDRRLNHVPNARHEYQQVLQGVPNTDLGRAAQQALESWR